jgi:hypothetical protein
MSGKISGIFGKILMTGKIWNILGKTIKYPETFLSVRKNYMCGKCFGICPEKQFGELLPLPSPPAILKSGKNNIFYNFR